MAQQDPSSLLRSMLANVKDNNFHHAFAFARDYAAATSDFSGIDILNNAEQAYKAMLRYDPDSSGNDAILLYGDTREALLSVADMYRYNAQRQSNLSRFYNTARTLSASHINITSALKNAIDAENAFDLANKTLSQQETINAATQRDNALILLFNSIWTAPHLSRSDKDALDAFISDANNSSVITRQILAAIWLSMQAFYDYNKLEILAIGAESQNPAIAARGVAGILLSLLRHHRRLSNNPRAKQRLKALTDNPNITHNIREAAYCMAKAMDTDRINRKMQEDILPNLQKLHSDIIAKTHQNGNLDKKDLADLLNPEKNPEWDTMLEDSGMANRLRELTDLQLEGSDVMMLAFAQLKGFSFFTSVANWFMPFINSHSALSAARDIDREGVVFNTILASRDFLCDSDKYSLALSLANTPESNRKMMTDQLRAQFDQLIEEKNDDFSSTAQKNFKNEILSYIRTLFRFYRLYPHKNEFDDPFRLFIDLADLPCIGSDIANSDTTAILAEFYFSREYYNQSIKLFTHLLDNGPSDDILQKLGYANAKLGNYSKALYFYLECESLYGGSPWIFKQIANTHKALGNHDSAAAYYAKALASDPDNIPLTRHRANALLCDHQYTEALHLFYKLDYLNGGSPRTWRPIAWCEFMNDNYLKSGIYYDKTLESPEATDTDRINAAHLALVTHDTSKAMELYAQAFKNSPQQLRSTLNQDAPILKKKGVHPTTLHIICDKLEYE